jgi:hypothetical protein
MPRAAERRFIWKHSLCLRGRLAACVLKRLRRTELDLAPGAKPTLGTQPHTGVFPLTSGAARVCDVIVERFGTHGVRSRSDRVLHGEADESLVAAQGGGKSEIGRVVAGIVDDEVALALNLLRTRLRQ